MSGLRGPFLIAAATALLAVGVLLEGGVGEVVLVAAAVLMPAALLMMAAPTGRGNSGARTAAVMITLLLGGGFALLLALRGRPATASWWLGLPLPLAVQIAMALVPLIVLGGLFARMFDGFRPTEESLETIRSLSDADS